MEKGNVMKRGVIVAAAAALAAGYGCERPNPYKLSGDTSVNNQECPTPSTGSGVNVTTGGNNNPSGGNTSSGSGNTMSTASGQNTMSTGTGEVQQEQTELDKREVDYSEALRTASILLVGDAPTLAQIYQLGDTPPDQQQAAYEQMIDNMLADKRFAQTMLDYYKYTFKMGGPATTAGEPTRDTAPTFAARLVVEGKDWRNIVIQQSNTCPTFDPNTGVFTDGDCTNLPMGMMHAGILTNPGVHSIFYGNLAFRRQRFIHETFLCKSANEQAGGEPTPNAPTDAPCTGGNPIPGYQNKWPVNVIGGKCNGGRIDFHEYTNGNVCANCHATWNHRAPLYGAFDKTGKWNMPTGTGSKMMFSVEVPVDQSPKAVLGDWLCVDATCPNGGQNFPRWKYSMNVGGMLVQPDPITDFTSTAGLQKLGQQISQDDEVLDCATKRIWNYAMGRADITEVGGRAWVTLPDRKDKNMNLLTQTKLTQYFKDNNYNLKLVLRKILVSDDFVRF